MPYERVSKDVAPLCRDGVLRYSALTAILAFCSCDPRFTKQLLKDPNLQARGRPREREMVARTLSGRKAWPPSRPRFNGVTLDLPAPSAAGGLTWKSKDEVWVKITPCRYMYSTCPNVFHDARLYFNLECHGFFQTSLIKKWSLVPALTRHYL